MFKTSACVEIAVCFMDISFFSCQVFFECFIFFIFPFLLNNGEGRYRTTDGYEELLKGNQLLISTVSDFFDSAEAESV